MQRKGDGIVSNASQWASADALASWLLVARGPSLELQGPSRRRAGHQLEVGGIERADEVRDATNGCGPDRQNLAWPQGA